MGTISELKEGLSIVEAEKFVKLADLVEFSKDESFVAKLETIKETVLGSKVDVESDEEILDESAETQKTSYDHML